MREDEEEGRGELRTAREEGRERIVLLEVFRSAVVGRSARGNRIGIFEGEGRNLKLKRSGFRDVLSHLVSR